MSDDEHDAKRPRLELRPPREHIFDPTKLESNESLLRSAAQAGDNAEIRRLLGLGTSVYAKASDDETYGTIIGRCAVHVAAEAGKDESLKMLITEFGVEVDTKSGNGSTPIHFAAQMGNDSTVALLASLGASVNEKGSLEFSPLHYAAQNGHTTTIQLLESLGADVTSRNQDGDTPLHSAAFEGFDPAIALLVSLGVDATTPNGNTGTTPLHVAARMGHASTIALLVELGANVCSKDSDGDTPLHEAASQGHSGAVRLLAEKGASIWAVNNFRSLPIHSCVMAVTSEDASIATLHTLIDLGSDVNAEELNGRRLIHIVAHQGLHQMLLSILPLQVDVDAETTNTKTTAVHLAAAHGHLPFLQILAAHGADFDHVDAGGDTPLNDAVNSGQGQAAEYLRAVNVAKTWARQGDVKNICAAIKSGSVVAPAQWIRVLSAEARACLFQWVTSVCTDARACYAALYRPVLSSPPLLSAQNSLLRRKIAHNGLVAIKELIVSYLVFSKIETHKMVFELRDLIAPFM